VSNQVEKMKATGFFLKPTEQAAELIYPEQLHTMFSDARNLIAAKKNASFLLALSLVRFAFEATIQYARERERMALLKKEAWFYYARIVRNVTSHGIHTVLQRWDDELTKKCVTTVTWRHRTLTSGDVGRVITFNEYDAWTLHKDVLDCVRNRLP
jgi:hypothetical protein